MTNPHNHLTANSEPMKNQLRTNSAPNQYHVTPTTHNPRTKPTWHFAPALSTNSQPTHSHPTTNSPPTHTSNLRATCDQLVTNSQAARHQLTINSKQTHRQLTMNSQNQLSTNSAQTQHQLTTTPQKQHVTNSRANQHFDHHAAYAVAVVFSCRGIASSVFVVCVRPPSLALARARGSAFVITFETPVFLAHSLDESDGQPATWKGHPPAFSR
jgi:hypothetical protein